MVTALEDAQRPAPHAADTEDVDTEPEIGTQEYDQMVREASQNMEDIPEAEVPPEIHKGIMIFMRLHAS